MKFIFPKNFDFRNKFLGIIDYISLIFIIIWCTFIFCLLNLFPISFFIKALFFIVFCFPFIIFGITGFNHENIIYVFLYLIKYLSSQKIYVFSKRI